MLGGQRAGAEDVSPSIASSQRIVEAPNSFSHGPTCTEGKQHSMWPVHSSREVNTLEIQQHDVATTQPCHVGARPSSFVISVSLKQGLLLAQQVTHISHNTQQPHRIYRYTLVVLFVLKTKQQLS